jgi:hypothetical protein
VSESSLHAQLLLTPDENNDLHSLGFVTLRIECKPSKMQEMTPTQTADWLRDAVERML